jgi:DNA (cytosine-5)-methyltransferase 1
MSEMRVQMVKKPSVVSLFAGCGGSSLGYSWAGFKELLAIDFDKNAVEVFKLNFPSVPVWERDIKMVTGKEILEACRLKRGALDVLDGSPPCQGFSTSGRRDINDPRNDLFLEYVRLIDELRPKVFVMENVGGMVKGKMKGRFIEIMKTLKALPYQVKCRLMNAKYYNVPQSRARLIWIGVRNDLGKEPSFPTPQRNVIPVKAALAGLPDDSSRTLGELGLEVWGKCRN